MASLKDERDESDVEEMEQDSVESEKSSTTSESTDGSDSDDSSELDAEECERRRNECLENLADMERQFGILKEQLYRERMGMVNKKLEEIQKGVAPEYLEPLATMEENMRVRIEVAGVLKEMRLKAIENQCLAEEQAALQNFENEKFLLFDSMKEDLEEKIRKLEEERNNADFQSDSALQEERNRACASGSGRGKGPMKKGLKPETGRKKPVTVSGPYIVYMLSEEEILEDWTAIKKALQSTKRKPYNRY